MSEQKNTMKYLIIFLILVFVSIAFAFFSYISYANLGNRTEKKIIGVWENNKNISGTCTNKILEIAQVPGMYRDDLIKIVEAEMGGRYSNQKQVMANFIRERSLSYNDSMYIKVQNEIIACANQFSHAQTTLTDIKRVYTTELDNVWGGFWLELSGYPKIDLSKYKIVVAENTEREFETGKRSPLNLR